MRKQRQSIKWWIKAGWLVPALLITANVSAQKVALHWTPPGNQIVQEDQNQDHVPLKQMLTDVEQQYGVKITYQSDLVEKRSIPVRQVRQVMEASKSQLERAVLRLVSPMGLRFRQYKQDYYILQKQSVLPKVKSGALELSYPQPVPRADANGAARTIQSRRPYEKTITGQVTDLSTGETLPGVNIVVKGTTIGTVTDVDGNYRLTAPDDAETLVFSSVGYTSEEVEIGNQTVVNLEMAPDIQSLSEVVVVGYGTQKKSDLTGSVGSISQEEVQAVPTLSLDQSLQGRVAGVQVTQANAQPGGAVSVRIRGGNSITAGNEPLYVVDGFIGAGDLNSINPNDIASIEILKDASATAIYGARGANGVVLITTKSGKVGKTQINVDLYKGVQEVRNPLELLNAQQYATLVNEVNVQNGQPAVFADPAALGEGTNWQDELFRTAPMENYQLSFSGGKESLQFLFSANYFNQDGVVENTGFKRYSVRANLSSMLTDKLKFGSNLTVSRTNKSRVGLEGDEFDGKGIVSNALIFSPTQPADASVNLNFGAERGNPLLYMQNVTDNNLINRVLGNSFLEYEIIEGLSIKTSFGADIIQSKNNFYLPATIFEGEAVNGQATISSGQSLNWLNENTITFQRNLGEGHELSLLGGITAQRYNFESFSATSLDFTNDALKFNDLGAGRNISIAPSSGANEWSLFSYLFRTNYSLLNRYLFTVTGRYDGSSRFGSGNKYAFFPSAAFGWRIIEESFMSSAEFISNLKLRASYGLTGSQEIGTFQSLAALGNDQLAFGENVTVGYFPTRFANQDLKWETTRQLDVGLDFGFLQDRISATVDYYYKRTQDLLLNVPVPLSTGFRSTLKNIGELENRGLEFSLNSVNVTGKFSWETSFNYSINRQKVLDSGSG